MRNISQSAEWLFIPRLTLGLRGRLVEEIRTGFMRTMEKLIYRFVAAKDKP